MRAVDSVGAALRDFAELYGLYTDAGTLRLEPERGGAWVCYDFLPIGRWGVRQIVQLRLGCIYLFVAESLGRREWHPTRTVLRELPADPRPYNEFFGHGVRFAQPRDAVFIDRETLDTRRHVSQVRSHVHRALLHQSRSPALAVVAQVKALVGTLLRHDQRSIEAMGAALSIAPRTLQRRLTDAGTRYRALIDEVRADLAWRHVQRSDVSLGQVANLLGYESQAAFSRAFRRWYDMTPRLARRPGAGFAPDPRRRPRIKLGATDE